jgi:hypothetical protein
MQNWINFGVVGCAALFLFIICAIYEKRTVEAPRLLLLGIIFGTPLGLISDLVLWGTYTYPLGYGFFYLLLNAAVIYGLLTATVLLLQKASLVRFSAWIIGMMAVYEITNHFFPVWNYTITPFIGLLLFVVVGNFATAVFIALVGHFLFKFSFKFVSELREILQRMKLKDESGRSGLRHALQTFGVVMILGIVFTLVWQSIFGRFEILDPVFEGFGELAQIISYGVGALISGRYIKKHGKNDAKRVLFSSTVYSAVLLGTFFLIDLLRITWALFLIFAIGAPLSILVFYLVSKKVLE